MKPIIVPGTESAIEPISVEEAGEHLRAANDGATPPVYVEAAMIARMIKAARQACEEELELSLINKRLEVSSDAWFQSTPCGGGNTYYSYIELPYGPVWSVEKVNYLDPEGVDQLLDPAEYRISRYMPIPRLIPKYAGAFPAYRRDVDAIRVQYNVGYPSGDSPPLLLPEPVRTAMYLLIGHFYDNREGISDKTFSELPLGVCYLLGKYRQSLGL